MTAQSIGVGFRDVVKEFDGVRVLHGVSFDLAPGRIYGLLGENGAGKSTLMKILGGYLPSTAGTVAVNGAGHRFASPRDAEALGTVLIHQEFNLTDELTIAQNVFLGHEKRRGWWLEDAAMNAETARVLALVGLAKAPGTPVRRLIVAEKQLVEIAKALARSARLLIMDEPTATLTPGETETLFGLMGRLKADGVTIIYISHKLDEVERMTDEVIVMRDGRFVTRTPTREVTRRQMANLMVGREISDLFPPKQPVAEGAGSRLSVRGLSVPGWASDIAFEVRSGEILGFAGLVGAGRTEAFEGLLGLRPSRVERVEIDGRAVRIGSPEQAARAGLTYLSEDRKGKGLHVSFGLAENLTLMTLRRYATPWLRPIAERRALETAVQAFGIRAGSLGMRAGSLSGGNQQKLALAKVLHPEPKAVVLDEPTRGVDIGAKREIYLLIQRLAGNGRAIVLISSELPELVGLCHRVVVIRNGRVQATVGEDRLTEEELIAHATGTRHWGGCARV